MGSRGNHCSHLLCGMLQYGPKLHSLEVQELGGLDGVCRSRGGGGALDPLGVWGGGVSARLSSTLCVQGIVHASLSGPLQTGRMGSRGYLCRHIQLGMFASATTAANQHCTEHLQHFHSACMIRLYCGMLCVDCRWRLL